MKNKSYVLTLFLCVVVLTFGFSVTSVAKDFPNHNIRYVNHNNPGSGTDRVARMMAKVITDNNFLPVPIKVENKPGGSGEVARAYVTQHAGDAHYLMTVQPTSLSVPLKLDSKFTFDTFTPIANLLVDTNVIAVSYDSPYKNLKDLIDAAKKEPGKITIVGTSMGGIEYFAQYLLAKAGGVKTKFLAVGATQVIPQVLGGHMDAMSANPTEVLQLYEAKKLRIIAVLSEERMASFPEIPTAREQGYDVVLYSFRGVSAAGNISEEEADYLTKVFEKGCQTDQWKEFVKKNGSELKFIPRKEYFKFLERENVKYEEMLKEAGMYKTGKK